METAAWRDTDLRQLGCVKAVRWTLVIAALALLAVAARSTTRAEAPGNADFQRAWERTDQPVAAGRVSRTWMWGPQANGAVVTERYASSPGGTRAVQYFDKSRMEITHPGGAAAVDPVWYVTNGLLVTEMVSGQTQIGDNEFVPGQPAAVNVAGDGDDPNGPTYATIAGLTGAAPLADGAPVVQRLTRTGQLAADPALISAGVTAAYYAQIPGIEHQIASPFWAFMNANGTVYQDDTYSDAPLFENPFYATGYPITEAYWATVKVGGADTLVLLQCFQRRCLTYTPSNATAWQVEAGNVGVHYHAWRYSSAAGDGSPTPTATATATATATTPTSSCDPSYPTICVPPPPPDLACGDISAHDFPVLPPDPHGFDPDGNGIGCESGGGSPSPSATATEPGDGSVAACLDSEEAAFLQLINTYRAAHGLAELTASAALDTAAYRHSLDMGQRDYFDHFTPLPLPPGQSGPSPADRMYDAGYASSSTLAENISAGYASAQAAFDSFKNSPPHDANMLKPELRAIGIGRAVVEGSTYTTYWTTDFGAVSDAQPGC